MRTLFLLSVIALATSCTKDPVQREVQLRAECAECNVQWSTSMGNSDSFHLIGERSITVMVDEDGYYSIDACPPDSFTIPGPIYDTLALVETSLDGQRTGYHYTAWVDSCAGLYRDVPTK